MTEIKYRLKIMFQKIQRAKIDLETKNKLHEALLEVLQAIEKAESQTETKVEVFNEKKTKKQNEKEHMIDIWGAFCGLIHETGCLMIKNEMQSWSSGMEIALYALACMEGGTNEINEHLKKRRKA